MATTSLTSTANGRTEKSKKPSKVVILRLSSLSLSRFLPKIDTPSTASSPSHQADEMVLMKPASSQDNASETNSTPAPGADDIPVNGTAKKKGTGSLTKRALTQANENSSRPRGKPGPKKKPRHDDGTVDHGPRTSNVVGVNGSKLGPKANAGNINANLRALDRSGTPCRKWARRGFQLKSFTGVSWELSTWKGGEKASSTDDSSDANKNNAMQDSSDLKLSESGTGLVSNTGEHLDRMEISTPAASPPAPAPAPAPLPAIIATRG